jgi:drug/metabolite transporter (DMT)-like permease
MTDSFHMLHAWTAISLVATLAVAGEVLVAAGMRALGDLDVIRAKSGLFGAIFAVLTNGKFVLGSLCMALNFFGMLYSLSISELTLAAPAIASLTFVGNAIAAKFFLKENVDHRRWIAVCCVVLGVVLISR